MCVFNRTRIAGCASISPFAFIYRNRLIMLTALSMMSLALQNTLGQDFQGFGRSGALLYLPSSGVSNTAMPGPNGNFSYQPNLFTAGFNIVRACDFSGDGKADVILYNYITALA